MSERSLHQPAPVAHAWQARCNPTLLNVAARGVGSSSEMELLLVTKGGHISIPSQTSSLLVNVMPISPDSL